MTDALGPELVTLDDLQAAARVLHGVAVRTPLLPVDSLRDQFPDGIWVKPEMLQRTGTRCHCAFIRQSCAGRGVCGAHVRRAVYGSDANHCERSKTRRC